MFVVTSLKNKRWMHLPEESEGVREVSALREEGLRRRPPLSCDPASTPELGEMGEPVRVSIGVRPGKLMRPAHQASRGWAAVSTKPSLGAVGRRENARDVFLKLSSCFEQARKKFSTWNRILRANELQIFT